MAARPTGDGGARSLVDAHAREVPATRRRAEGVHYTPPALAEEVVDMGVSALGALPRTVCDPSCGAGGFLLAAAQRLVEHGLDVHEVATSRLHGLELDPEAAAVARRVIARWAAAHGVEVRPAQVRVHVGDAMSIDARHWPDRPGEGFDMVVGNPPFLSQLSTRTARSAAERARVRRRFGDLGSYTDTAALFLVLGLELAADRGVVAMVQPQSFLAARGTATLRGSLLERSELVALWGSDGRAFPDADVQVTVPVLRRGRGRAEADRTEVRWQGARPMRYLTGSPRGEQGWGALFATAVGLPELAGATGPPLSSVATATAGFRDEYYALREATIDAVLPAADEPGGHVDRERRARLVTVGMIDPLRLRWGRGPHRIGGRGLQHPQVDLARLEQASPKVARWARARRRPKVLVATQTKVVEAIADPVGDLVPMTPVISVEPAGDDVDVWHLVAALLAPPVAVRALREHLGAGRSSDTLRWSARALQQAALPVDAGRWATGAALARQASVEGLPTSQHDALLEQLARTMTEAHGLSGHDPVVQWWCSRRPRR